MKTFDTNDILIIKGHTSPNDTGLTYPTCSIVAGECGNDQSWQIYHGWDLHGQDIDFYGFSVLAIEKHQG